MLQRRTLMVLGCLVVMGCATEHPPDYFKPPPPVALQDAPPGMSVVYLIRTPHDSRTVVVHVEGMAPFSLPPETHTVLLLKPGTYSVHGTQSGLFSAGKPSFAPAQLRTSANQRLFLYLSGNAGQGVQLAGFIPIAGGGVVPLVSLAMETDADTRSWKNCSEQDAQGFLSIARYVRPD